MQAAGLETGSAMAVPRGQDDVHDAEAAALNNADPVRVQFLHLAKPPEIDDELSAVPAVDAKKSNAASMHKVGTATPGESINNVQ
jgi:hypothetical protein